MHCCTSKQPHTPCAFTPTPCPYPLPNSTDKPQCPMTPNHKTRTNKVKPINCISRFSPKDTNTNTKIQLIVSHQHQRIKPKTEANINKVINKVKQKQQTIIVRNIESNKVLKREKESHYSFHNFISLSFFR